MPIVRIFGILCYLALAVLILGFIFNNRSAVSIDLFPFGSTNEMPLYIVLALLFSLGLGLGLLHSFTIWAGMRGKLKRAERAIAQLEKEIAARAGSTM